MTERNDHNKINSSAHSAMDRHGLQDRKFLKGAVALGVAALGIFSLAKLAEGTDLENGRNKSEITALEDESNVVLPGVLTLEEGVEVRDNPFIVNFDSTSGESDNIAFEVGPEGLEVVDPVDAKFRGKGWFSFSMEDDKGNILWVSRQVTEPNNSGEKQGTFTPSDNVGMSAELLPFDANSEQGFVVVSGDGTERPVATGRVG